MILSRQIGLLHQPEEKLLLFKKRGRCQLYKTAIKKLQENFILFPNNSLQLDFMQITFTQADIQPILNINLELKTKTSIKKSCLYNRLFSEFFNHKESISCIDYIKRLNSFLIALVYYQISENTTHILKNKRAEKKDFIQIKNSKVLRTFSGGAANWSTMFLSSIGISCPFSFKFVTSACEKNEFHTGGRQKRLKVNFTLMIDWVVACTSFSLPMASIVSIGIFSWSTVTSMSAISFNDDPGAWFCWKTDNKTRILRNISNYDAID